MSIEYTIIRLAAEEAVQRRTDRTGLSLELQAIGMGLAGLYDGSWRSIADGDEAKAH